MTINQIWKTSLAGAVALLAACGDSTGGSGSSASGSLSFSYTGDRTGSYSASGTFKQNSTSFVKQPFAVGVRSSTVGGQGVVLVSYTPVSSATGNMLLIGIPSTAASTASYDLADENCNGTTTLCPFSLLLFDTNPDLEEDDSQVFTFTSGTLNVTSNSGSRLQGNFSGTAETLFGDSVITITNGTFDIPVRSESSLGNRVAAVRLSRAAKPE